MEKIGIDIVRLWSMFSFLMLFDGLLFILNEIEWDRLSFLFGDWNLGYGFYKGSAISEVF